MKNLSNNSLEELLELYNRMQTELQNFSHVGKSVIRAVEKERNKVITELTVRDLSEDINIDYCKESETYYWEDYHLDTYRQGFKTSKECIKDADKWVREQVKRVKTVWECGRL